MTRVRLEPKKSNTIAPGWIVAIFGFCAAGLLFVFNFHTYRGGIDASTISTGTQTGIKKLPIASDDVFLIEGNVNGVPYYHCDGRGGNVIHMVLLHGSAFTKEDWKTSGILEKFCRIPSLGVSAMDLPVSANHEDLMSLLTAMREQKLVSTPVTLVTPSASGKTIIDWIMSTDGSVVDKLPSYVNRWIPIATYGVSKFSTGHLDTLKKLDISTLAVYGDKDTNGKAVAGRLHQTGARLVEVPGAHPCYLDSPQVFVDKVLDFLGIST